MPKSPNRKTAGLEISIADASRSSGLVKSPTQKAKAQAGRIMYIECKAGGLTGTARIGRVTFSKTGRTLYYSGHTFQSLKGAGFKSNYYCAETGEDYWISGPKRRGGDALYGGNLPIEIDDDVREEYWREVRRQPERGTREWPNHERSERRLVQVRILETRKVDRARSRKKAERKRS
jgi:hypothetical protein